MNALHRALAARPHRQDTSCAVSRWIDPENRVAPGTFLDIGYHSSVRRLFYILLILLLPLRGWTGDAMANHMALSTPVQHAHMAAVVGHMDHDQGSVHLHSVAKPAVVAATADCENHGGNADGTSPTDAAHCGACLACQTCHTVAVLLPMPVAGHGPMSLTAPRHAAQGFTSADGASALKPPTA